MYQGARVGGRRWHKASARHGAGVRAGRQSGSITPNTGMCGHDEGVCRGADREPSSYFEIRDTVGVDGAPAPSLKSKASKIPVGL